MSLPDTAEYWQDVKRHRELYTGPDYYHIPEADCGRKHWHLAKRIEDVNCKDCLELIKNGFLHGLPPGKTDFRSNSQKRRDKEAEERRKEQELLGNYPKCKKTSKMPDISF